MHSSSSNPSGTSSSPSSPSPSSSASSLDSASSSPPAEALALLGYHPSFAAALEALGRPDLVPARVVAHLGERLQLAGATSHHAAVSGRALHQLRGEERPTVGDWVAIADGRRPEQLAVLHHVLPRRTAMIRRAAGRRGEGQAVAANVDTFLIVTSANRDANPRRLERYLAAVWDSGARPLVVLNKADLCEAERLAELRAELERCAPHVGVHAVSAHTGEGFAELLDAAVGATPGYHPTLAFVGMSGVGKSSLVNRLLGLAAGDDLPDGAEGPPTGQVAPQPTLPIDANDRGRHATTRRELFVVSAGVGPAATAPPGVRRSAVVIDTPGMRSLGLVDDEGGLAAGFADISELAAACRFTDCGHTDEPGCAVRQAVARGALEPGRLASLQKLEGEVRAAEVRRDPAQAASAKRRMKSIHVAQRARYKLDPKGK